MPTLILDLYRALVLCQHKNLELESQPFGISPMGLTLEKTAQRNEFGMTFAPAVPILIYGAKRSWWPNKRKL